MKVRDVFYVIRKKIPREIFVSLKCDKGVNCDLLELKS